MTAHEPPPAGAVSLRHALYTRPANTRRRWRLHSTHATAEACRHAAIDARGVDVWVTTTAAEPSPPSPPDRSRS